MYVIVAGGGKIGHYLSRALVDAGHEVLLVEKDKARADYLAEELGEAVALGDACEVRTMREIGMERADVVVAVTGDDEDNLVICQMAKLKFNVPRAIARVNNPENEDIFQRLGIDTTVSSTKIIFNLIEQQIETNEVKAILISRVTNHSKIHGSNHLAWHHIVITWMWIGMKESTFQHFLDNDTRAVQRYLMAVITSQV